MSVWVEDVHNCLGVYFVYKHQTSERVCVCVCVWAGVCVSVGVWVWVCECGWVFGCVRLG